MQVNGACHCGEITFTAEADANFCVICHCRDCQVMSGAPYRSILPVQESDFNLLSGTLKLYHKTGDSGNRRELAFCGDCATHVYATSVVEDVPLGKRMLGLRTGMLAEVADLPPQKEVWCESKIDWAQSLVALDMPKQNGQ
jgi:hypothetical protein